MTTETPQTSQTKSYLIRALKYLFAALVIYFATNQALSRWDEIAAYPWEIDWLLLALSLVAHLVPLLVFANVWRILIAGFGHNQVTLPQAFKIAYLSSLGRYIPGKVWQVFGMIYLAKQIQIKEEAAIASWALTQMFAIPASFVVFAICFYLEPSSFAYVQEQNLGTGLYMLSGFMFALSVFVVVLPNQALAIYNLFLGLIKRQPVRFTLSRTLAAKVYLGYLIGWSAFGLAFWLFVSSITPNTPLSPVAATGAFVLAYQVGYLVFFSPGGLGARELALTIGLQSALGPVAAGIALAARLWSLLAEGLASLVALAIRLENKEK